MVVRPIDGDAELQRCLDIRAAVSPYPITLDEWRAFHDLLPAYEAFIALDGVEAVGTATVQIEPERAVPVTFVYVLRERRRHGHGDALFRAVSSWARELGHAEAITHVSGQESDSLAFAEHRGFREVSRETVLSRDLTQTEPPIVDPPEGVEIVPLADRPESIRGLYEVYLEAAPDVPGDEEDTLPNYEDWRRMHMSLPNDRPEATFVALAGPEVVGYSKFHLTAARPTVAVHDLTGVKRAWRGRGIARALKAT